SAGSKIYQWQPSGSQGWSLWLDLSKDCGTEISRFLRSIKSAVSWLLSVSAGSKIYQWQPSGSQGWSLWLDLSKDCGTEISR
ncbi:hypothetical protein CP993_25865, partial [Escherichia coli]